MSRKVVLLGSSSSGKTTFIQNVTGRAPKRYPLYTVLKTVEVAVLTIEGRRGPLSLSLWDANGTGIVTAGYYLDATCYLIFIDGSALSEDTKDNIDSYYKLCKMYADAPVLIIGNRLTTETQIHLSVIAAECGCRFIADDNKGESVLEELGKVLG